MKALNYNTPVIMDDGSITTLESLKGTEPTGTITITENGTGIDVAQYAKADVAVPEPTGTITITANGTDIDVAQYAKANVNVAGGAAPYEFTELHDFGNITTYSGGTIEVDMSGYTHLLVGIKTTSTYAARECLVTLQGISTSTKRYFVATTASGGSTTDVSGSNTYARGIKLDASNYLVIDSTGKAVGSTTASAQTMIPNGKLYGLKAK